MKNEELKQKIEDVIDNFLSQDKSFTAYDVTKLIRTEVGQADHISHREVRKEVHKQMLAELDKDYEKTKHTIQTKDGMFEVEVYHHFVCSAADYDPNEIPEPVMNAPDKEWFEKNLPNDNPEVGVGVGVGVPVPVPVAWQNAVENAVGKHQRDDRGRLLVNAHFIKHMNLKANDIVDIHKEVNTIVLSNPAIGNNLEKITSIQVDKHGYLYLSSKVLKEANINEPKLLVKTSGFSVLVQKG